MVEPNDPRLVFVSLEEAAIAPDGLCQHYKDRWWSYDPERGVIFWKPERRSLSFPQCNSNEYAARYHGERMYPWAEIKFISSVFTQANPLDYI